MDSSRLRILSLLGLALIAYLWATPWRDLVGLEARNGLMAREMLENGFGLIPTTMGLPYPDYPPLYFWLATVAALPFGHVTTFSTVLPSALAACALLAITYRLGQELDPQTGLLAALILATLPDFWLHAARGTIDMLLALHVTGALACLYFAERAHRYTRAYTFGALVFLALAFLTKGLIGLVLPGLVWGGYLLLERRWGALLRFVLLMALVTLACLGAQALALWAQGGGALLHTVISAQLASRVGQEPNEPVYFYVAYLTVATLPWWLWALPAVGERLRRGPRRPVLAALVPRTALNRLALPWIAGIVVLFTLASTRKGRYLLPLYPAVALVLAQQVRQVLARGGPRHARRWNGVLLGLSAALLLAVWLLIAVRPQYRGAPLAVLLVWSAILILAAYQGWTRLKSGRRAVALMALFLATGLSAANIVADPALSQQRSGRPFVEALEARAPPDRPLVLFRIPRDNDGVRVALYSHRAPSTLRFVDHVGQLRVKDCPCIIIAYPRDAAALAAAFPHPGELRILLQGRIKSDDTTAYLLDAPSAANG